VVISTLPATSSAKAGRETAPSVHAEPGVVEHPDDDLWDSIVIACRQAMSRFPGDPQDIIALVRQHPLLQGHC